MRRLAFCGRTYWSRFSCDSGDDNWNCLRHLPGDGLGNMACTSSFQKRGVLRHHRHLPSSCDVCQLFGINPIKALLWAGVIEGLLAAPLMLLTMLIANNHTIMGRWVNRPLTNIVGWTTTVVTFAASSAWCTPGCMADRNALDIQN